MGFGVWGLGFGVWGLGFGITNDWFAAVGTSSSSKVGEHYKLRGGMGGEGFSDAVVDVVVIIERCCCY